MFMLIYIAKTGEVKFINGTGVAPMAANVDFYKGKGGIPSDGILSVTVPGAVAGAELAAKTYGTRPLSELMAPAVELAERGFPVTESLAGAIKSSGNKLSPSAKEIWYRGNTPLGFGDRVIQKDLARHAARDRRERQRRVLPGADRRQVRRLHESRRRPDRPAGSCRHQGQRRRADQDQLQGRRGLRMPAELAGLRDAAGAQHPRRDERALHAPQQRAVPARRDRIAEAGVCRSQQVRRRSEVHAEHPDARDAVEGIRDDPPRADRSGQGDRRRSAVRQSHLRADRSGGATVGKPRLAYAPPQVLPAR